MIQATHLRIGNWVNPIGDKPQQVRTIKEQAAKDGSFYTVNGFLVEHLQPIPLSPDILEKCGFECTTKGHYRKANMGEVYLKESPQGWLVKMYPATPLTSVKHVHQLMNLYFVITGEELTLNL